MDYSTLIKDKFPEDERNDLYKVPNIPAVELGKLLRKDTRIASPADILAMHSWSSVFSAGSLLLTRSGCFYPKGSFLWEDIKEYQHKGNEVTVFVNQNGQLVPHQFSVKNEQVAKSLAHLFDAIRYTDPKSEAQLQQVYEAYNPTEVEWLKLRDEIMRTIDMLYERYNDGKLTLLEYEQKKEELLARL